MDRALGRGEVTTIRLGSVFVYAAADGTLRDRHMALHVVHGNMMATTILQAEQLSFEWEDGKVRASDAPFPAMFASYDFMYRPNGHDPILLLEGDKLAARIRGEWIVADGERRLRLTRVRDGKTAAPVDRFWVTSGYKLLPAEGSGYWMMGALGEAYVRIGDDLARTDELTFFERLRRLFRQDRGKRNSDIYWSNAVMEKLAVGWALFPPLVIAIAALVARKRPRLDLAVYAAALSWLAVMMIAGWTAWRIIWHF